MDQSKQHAIRFLEKEIKTYTALALFLSKKGIKEEPVKVKGKGIFIRPAFYKMRMKEAKRIVSVLRKSN